MAFGSILGDVLKKYNSVPQSTSDVQNVSHDDALNHFQQLMQQSSPQQASQAAQQAFQQLPPDQQQRVFSELLSALQQQGINPQQIGIQGTNSSPSNFGQVVQYACQKPDLFQKLFSKGGALSSPIAKLVLVGALAVAADKYVSDKRKASNKGGTD